MQAWAEPRHLAAHYGQLVRALDDLALKRNTAARLAKGTVPRWFAVLPCDRPLEVWETSARPTGAIPSAARLLHQGA